MTNQRWSMPTPKETRPNRNFGGIFRTAEKQGKGTTLGGVPLQTATAAVLATVQLGYKVADAQIDRGRRLARQVRGAAQRAGIGDEAQALDATERLLLRGLQLGLEWIEGAAAGPRSPLRRIAEAEYKLIGSLLGLRQDAAPATATSAPAAASPLARAAPAAAAAAPAPPALLLRHAKDSARRDVQVIDGSMQVLDKGFATELWFRHRDTPAAPRLVAALVVNADGSAGITFTTLTKHPAGRWRAAICDDTGLQLGRVEIEL